MQIRDLKFMLPHTPVCLRPRSPTPTKLYNPALLHSQQRLDPTHPFNTWHTFV